MIVEFDSPAGTIELSEEQDGFDMFSRIAAERLCFPREWWETLARPAFKRNQVTLFRRPQ
jgi:hypothetical protein